MLKISPLSVIGGENPAIVDVTANAFLCILFRQDAQLSQRDRAAEWVSYGQKWKTGTGRHAVR